MTYNFLRCDWDEIVNHPIMANDSKSYCHLYFYKDDPTVAYLGDLYVIDSERKMGRGKELLKYALDLAEKCGCNKLVLRVDYHSWVLDWYKREGFELYQVDDEEPEKYVWYEKKIILKN